MGNESIMMWQQQLTLDALPRGFHRIDSHIDQLLITMPQLAYGTVHLFLRHTSASLLITENCCQDVKRDLAIFYDQIAPDGIERYHHNVEGPDDMPAHIKSSLLGVNLTLPVTNGKLALGTWQGVYLAEHRDHATKRHILVTAQGQKQTKTS